MRNHFRRLLVFALASLLIVTQVGCDATSGSDSRPMVLCTTSIIADAAQRIGGESLHVEALMPPGVDPHRYQPTGSDSAKLRKARLIFHNGLHLEGKMTDMFDKSGTRAVAVTKTINRSDLRKADGDFPEAYDPHVWFDVKLWQKAVECMRDELCTLDPAHAVTFRTNAATYLRELDELDAEIRTRAASLPPERRILVTSHDAFGYFGRAYGFEVHGLQGVSTASEVASTDRVELAKLLGEKKVRAVFTETSVPEEGLKAVLETARKDWNHHVRLVGEGALYSDSLGPVDSPGGTYSGMFRHNINTIVEALSK